MKGRPARIMIALLLVTAAVQLHAQNIPDINIGTVKGGMIPSRTLCDGNTPVVVSFWATWCKPCIKELDTISELLDEWREDTCFRFAAISVDDSRSVARARSFAAGRGWEGMEFYFDSNSDLIRALGISTVPHVMVFDKDGKLIYRHSGYVPGDEDGIIAALKNTRE